MRRLTDKDYHFGPITCGRSYYKCWGLVFNTGEDEDEPLDKYRNHLKLYAFGWVFLLSLPNLVSPWKRKIIAVSWDEDTVKRLGRNWYWDVHPRQYGVTVNDGFLQLFLGPQTDDSKTTKNKSWFLPWTQWRFVSNSWYDCNGTHLVTLLEPKDRKDFNAHWDVQHHWEENVPKMMVPMIDESSHTEVIAALHINERRWEFGTGWFTWLRFFRKPLIRRNLNINFDKEVGPDKGSWKGGLTGDSITMEPGENLEAAFNRYCAKSHRSKSGHFTLKRTA